MAHIAADAQGNKYIADDWCIEDIQSVAENMNLPYLLPEQVEAVMDLIVESFDANIGINWEVIENAIEEVMEK